LSIGEKEDLEMNLVQLNVLYGCLEGTEGRFSRDPSGYLSMEAGIFRAYGLEVSWQHVQGTEERYRRLESGAAQISLVVGRASLQHFLDSGATRILGCAMNSCPYYLVAGPAIRRLGDLNGKTIACREGPARNVPFEQTFRRAAGLRLDKDVALELPASDHEAFGLLISGKTDAALLPRPYGFIAEEKGFARIKEWPDIVDDPLPITIETTASLLRDREKDFLTFLDAHRDGIRYLKTHRAETIGMLGKRFGHSPSLAARTFDDYLICMDERLTVDFKQLERLLAQIAPLTPGGAKQVAAEWIMPGALRS
jgi:ABC-type nitrate/sulfonate/bicarbonate transport system substrate-binding protein